MHAILLGNTAADESSDVKGIIGAILDSSSRIGQEQVVAMKLALEDFYQKSNQSFALHIRNSQGDPLLAAVSARDLIDNQKVQAIIGPQTWEETSSMIEVSSQRSIPLLSLADTTPEWAMKKWHFLLQSSPSQVKQMKAIAEIVKSWKLYKVSMIYEDGDSSSAEVLSQLSVTLAELGAELSNVLPIPSLGSSSLSQELEKLREGQCRVFIVHLSFHLALHLFETAKRMKMMEEGNVWITTGTFTSLVHSLNASTISNMQGVIGVKSYIPNLWHQNASFYHRFRKKFSSQNFEEFNYEPGIFAAQAYDAAWTVLQAMRETNQKDGQGQLLLDKILLSTFTGLSGKIQFTDHKIAPAHTFQIIDVIGRSYRELGFWSDELGFSKTLDQNASYSSLVKGLGKKYDAVVGDVAIVVSTRYEYASFTQPYSDPGLAMIVPVKSKTGNRAWLFMKPFTKLMWILTLVIIFYNGFVVWMIERNHHPELKDPLLQQTTTILWLAFFSLFSLDVGRLRSNLSRVAMVVWLFVALIITQTYTASLASMLTAEELEPTIDSIQQLKNSNAKVGYDRGSYLRRYLQDALHINAENIKKFNSPQQYADALRNKEIAAAFLPVPEAKIFLARHCKGFVQAGPTYKIGGYGFVFPKGSPLLHGVSQALLNLSESGILRNLENSMFASEKCKDKGPGAETTSLGPGSFMVLLILTGGTSTTALLIYMFPVNYLCLGQRRMWSLMMAAVKRWGSQKRLFSRRVHNIAESPLNSSNISNLPTLA
ncbi:hypothetical protein VNO77_37511 [Canavalia gladiata]|uniref:Glutamate receptor n=1 Tax=Canavalia gladiata TaxID=3824 RepID=A0AAN9PUT6_CANGL